MAFSLDHVNVFGFIYHKRIDSTHETSTMPKVIMNNYHIFGTIHSILFFHAVLALVSELGSPRKCESFVIATSIKLPISNFLPVKLQTFQESIP